MLGKYMKKKWIAIANILIIVAIFISVFVYASENRKRQIQNSISNFDRTTSVLGSVVLSHLQSEQQICDTLYHFIDNKGYTMEEAMDIIRSAKVEENSNIQIIYQRNEDDFAGVSSEANSKNTYTVYYNSTSYSQLNFFSDDFITEESTDSGKLKTTVAFVNPITGVQSIGFCNKIHLVDRDAYLLYIMPVSHFKELLQNSFPDEYSKADFSIITKDGGYVYKGNSFKNTGYFDFYQSYNDVGTKSQFQQYKDNFVSQISGYEEIKNSTGKDCIVSHIRIEQDNEESLILLTMIEKDSFTVSINLSLVFIVGFSLTVLLIMDAGALLLVNRELEASARMADEANRAKTDFLSTMSHDIRTPMNAIIGLTALATKNIEDKEIVQENLKKINLASNHLLTLINDILDISKIESGKIVMNPATFSIVDLSANLVNMAQPMVKEKNIDFDFRIHEMNHEYLYADSLRINQICINLLSNALKYTPPGGKVTIDFKEQIASDPKHVILTIIVSDTGIGMTKEFMKNMYAPFSRQVDSRVNVVQGTGLGLSITKKMVDLMNGTIECESVVDQGTTFTATLEIPMADKLLDEMILPNMRVLLADDDEVLRESASDTFKSMGVDLDLVSNGTDAVHKVIEMKQKMLPYQVVILDWKMPGMSGIETCKAIRKELPEDAIVLVISAYDWSDIEEEAREAGVNGFIHKPLFKSTIYEKMNQLLHLRDEEISQEQDEIDISGMNILVAEDNDMNWEIIHELLEMYEINTERAINGQVALDRIKDKSNIFDLIFMDIQMPVMNGYEATKEIRKFNKEIPIIAMTADAFSENIAQCLEVGMNGHIAKPIDMKLVVKEIEKVKEKKYAKH